MKTVLTEDELIRAIIKRDPACFAILYDQYAEKLLKIIYCSVKDLRTAETVLEQTLLFICNNCHDCRQQNKSLLLWMAGIARRFALKRARLVS